MKTIKKTLFTGWHLMRWLRLVFGIFFIVQAILMNDLMVGAIAGFFLITAITNLSAVPATVVTMFGVITQLYHSRIKWGIVPLTFLIGTAGWAIGGAAAVVDSSISMNRVLHNTLWVPAHFHTYLLMGTVLFVFGFLFYLFSENENQDGGKLAKIGFWIFVAGGHGFLAMFYFGGLSSIPRRYADYSGIAIKSVHNTGELLAQIAVWLIALLLIGLFIMYYSLFSKLFRRKMQSAPVKVDE